MPEQHLDDADIDLLLKQVGREAVTQRVHGHPLLDAGGFSSGVYHAIELPRAQGQHGIRAGEQPPVRADPALGMCRLPPGAKALQEQRRKHRVAILAALALLHAQRHALAVDVRHPQSHDLADAKASAVGNRQRRAVLDIRRCHD